MSRTIVRTARDADVPEIERLVARAGADAPLDWATLISALGVTVATRDDRVAGVLVAWPHPDHVLVDLLAVAPDAQDGRIGTALLDGAELLAIETGADAVRVRADRGAAGPLGVLVQHGFTATAGRASDDGRVLLEKRLR
jgi:N-acetylglutamate synthase-like GNAT family acetyltransferase